MDSMDYYFVSQDFCQLANSFHLSLHKINERKEGRKVSKKRKAEGFTPLQEAGLAF